jgi:hypothetical protein
MSAPYTGIGATCTIASTALVNPVKVSLPHNMDVKTAEYTTLTQTDKCVRIVPTVVSPDKISAEMIYSSADVATLTATRATLVTLVLVTTDSTPKTYTATGCVTKLETEISPDAIIMTKWEFTTSGPITVA